MVRHWNPPPRDQLPPDVYVEQVPFFGRTWYKRGIAYWLRRVVGVVMMAGTVAALFAVTVVVGKGIDEASRTGFHVVFILWLIYSIATFAYHIRRHVRRWHNIDLLRKDRPLPKWGLRLARGGPAVGIMAYAGSALAAFFLALGAVFTVGMALAFLIISFDPVPPLEWRARYGVAIELDYAEWMDALGNKASRRRRQRRKKVQGRIKRGDYDQKPFWS